MKAAKMMKKLLFSAAVSLPVMMVALAMPAMAQDPLTPVGVTVPPAGMPVAVADSPAQAVAAGIDTAAPLTEVVQPVTAPVASPINPTAPVVPAAGQPAAPASAAANIPGLPTNTPNSVITTINTLQRSQSNVSLEDIARAQDSLTRLDLLLQIEQKLGEIKRAQNERTGAPATSFGTPNFGGTPAIPASALNLPTTGGIEGVASAPVTTVKRRPAVIKHDDEDSPAGFKVERVAGANGRFTAVMLTPGGDRRTVRQGDEISGQTVSDISADGVVLRGSKGTKKINVENSPIPLVPLAR